MTVPRPTSTLDDVHVELTNWSRDFDGHISIAVSLFVPGFYKLGYLRTYDSIFTRRRTKVEKYGEGSSTQYGEEGRYWRWCVEGDPDLSEPNIRIVSLETATHLNRLVMHHPILTKLDEANLPSRVIPFVGEVIVPAGKSRFSGHRCKVTAINDDTESFTVAAEDPVAVTGTSGTISSSGGLSFSDDWYYPDPVDEESVSDD